MTTEGLSIPKIAIGRTDELPGSGSRHSASSRRVTLPGRSTLRSYAVDATVILLAVLDVWLIIPEKAQTYSVVLSGFACLALAARRWLPFTVLLATVPGFFVGWSQLAAMFALGLLATRKQFHWQVYLGAGLIWLCRFIRWPLEEFAELSWREHVIDAIYGVVVAGMPIAIGLLIGARAELAKRLAELAASRDRERILHAQAVRADERAKLARDMHDLVSHDITLIAMQANALSVANTSAEAQRTAETIRSLSKHTLEELRSLVGLLRSSGDGERVAPGIPELDQLVRNTSVPVHLTVEGLPAELPDQVSAAAYRTVQECLTNVHKHAPGARATVRVHGGNNGLAIEVSNAPGTVESAGLPSGGHGLTGMAERAKMLGGTFETAPTADGGFRVRARYPVA